MTAAHVSRDAKEQRQSYRGADGVHLRAPEIRVVEYLASEQTY